MTYHGEGYTIDIHGETESLLEANKAIRETKRKMAEMGKQADDTSKAFYRFDKTAMAVSSALKMPEINRLSRQMSELTGQIGAASAATDRATNANARFTGIISNVSGLLGAGYISNIGSATSSLLQHTQGAINATQAEVSHTRAIQMKAQALQAAASQEVINARNLTVSAQAELKAAQAALEHVYSLEAANDAKQRDLESLRARQAVQLKDAEITYQMAASEENLQRVTKASNALHATETKIKTHLATTGKEIARVEAQVAKAKEVEANATHKLNAALALEQKAKATLATTTDAVTAANNRAAQAAKTQSMAMQGLRGAVGLLGGPTGVFFLAAAGVYALYNAMNDDTATKEFNDRVDQWIDKIDELSAKQARVVANRLGEKIAETTTELDGQKKSLSTVNQELEGFKNQLATSEKAIQSMKDRGDAVDLKPNIGSEFIKKIEELTKKQQQYELLISEGEQNIRRWTVSQGKAADIAKVRAQQTDELTRAELIYQRQAKGVIDANQQVARSLELGSEAAVKKEQAIKELEKALIADGFVKDSEIFKQKIQELTDEFDKTVSLNLANSLTEIEQRTQALTIGMKDGKPALDEYNASLLLMQMGLQKGSAAYNTELPKAIEAIRKLREAQEAALSSKSKGNKSAKAANQANEAIKRQSEQLATLKKRYGLLESGAADVNRQMAIYEAVQRLGAQATEKQKAAISKEAAELFDLNQRVNDFIAAQEVTPELKLAHTFGEEVRTLKRMLDEGFIDKADFERMGREAMVSFNQGMSDIKINASVNYIEENRAKFDPIQALANEQAKKLVMMENFHNQEQALLEEAYAKQQMTHEQFTAAKEATDAQYLMLRTASQNEFNKQMTEAGWQILRQQNLGFEMLTGAIDSFAGNASNALTGIITGSMSAEDALRSMGSTILNTLVNSFVQMGVEMVKNFILSQTLGKASAMAAAATATAGGAAALAAWTPAAIAASIATLGTASATGLTAFQTAMAGGQMGSKLSGMGTQAVGMAFGGGRESGGPVSADKYYRVGENGKPEIFKASSGKQYMIPGDNGRVISNKDIGVGSGGGGNITQEISITINTTNGIQDDQLKKLKDMMETMVLKGIKDQKRSGGLLEKVP
ncbi:hypothetical protein P2E05_12190 [Providencia stuartii]|uniref:hypothetical protein n=1 Tax=Providencia stuartii TaxID=588 RepID=UPI0023E0B249|nr:hypothetical protein [Providencia stuartii]WER20867.1 hypothetical protein P2E04_12185 [Providencia stuartii]WER24987.1 hypothetical protein P2E05_12190 [Providencia stuartii]WER29077.1 hypothetical protein P2E06_12190 [Providencia stuartii]